MKSLGELIGKTIPIIQNAGDGASTGGDSIFEQFKSAAASLKEIARQLNEINIRLVMHTALLEQIAENGGAYLDDTNEDEFLADVEEKSLLVRELERERRQENLEKD